MRHCRKRNKLIEVNVNNLVINCVIVCAEFNPILFTSLSLEESSCDIVGRENRGCCAKLCAHIGNRCSFGNGKRFNSLSAVFNDLANAALDAHNLKHLEDNILCGNPRLKLTFEIYTNHFRHCDVVCAAAHCDSNVKSACTHRKHTYSAACRGVAVRADKSFSGDTEALKMNLMANTVAGTGEAKSSFLCNRLNETVIVSIFKACLQGVVIYISNGKLRSDTVNSHCLKLKVRHCTGCVLCKRLINSQTDFTAHRHIAGKQMIFNDFLSYSVSHSNINLRLV